MKAVLAFFLLSVSYVACSIHHIPLTRTKVYTENLGKSPYGLLDPYTLRANISLGTPPQHFSVLLDTTSTDFWVVDASCSDVDAEGRNTFNSSASSTYYSVAGSLDDFDSTDTDYESVPLIYGNLAQDTLKIAGLSIENVFFGLATDLDNFPAGFDGVLGLAFPQIGINSQMSSFGDILADEKFTNKSFSIYLSENSSTLILGGVDKKYANSTFQYVPIIDNGMWSFVGHISVGSVAISYNIELMISTGVMQPILLPLSILHNFLQITGLHENTYYQPDILNVLRPIEIETQSGTLTIPSSLYMFKDENGLYQLNIQSQNDNPTMVLLGDMFLGAYYTHFDYENKRIGFAEVAKIEV